MAILEVRHGDPTGAIQELLRSLLVRGEVSAVLVPQEIHSRKTVIQTLVRDPGRLERVNPLAPVFGVNSARIVAKMSNGRLEGQAGTGEGDDTKQDQAHASDSIAVVLRPCEIRALVELVKLKQASMDPIVVIGVDCWGTYSVQDYAAKVDSISGNSSVTRDFLKHVTGGEPSPGLRRACTVCQYPVPTYADLAFQLIGEDITKQVRLQAFTEKGRGLLTSLELEETQENDCRESALAKLKDARRQTAEKEELEFLESISSLCINCHNCRSVCPICYCRQCIFEGKVLNYTMDKYLSWSGKKGIIGMPPDKLLFHLTRMSHVATSCVACGQCEAACPSDIPLGLIYQRISEAAQRALDYEAGLSLDDALPLTTFREDELTVVES